MRSNHCILIVLYPRLGHALYLDSTRSEKKDYTRLRKVLNDALNGCNVKLGGNFVSKKGIKADTPVIFGHKTDFCCVQQPKESRRDAYYVILHMMEYARSRDTFKKATDVIDWGKRMAEITDEDLRLEFLRIQLTLAKIINKDVYLPGGMFHVDRLPPQEVEDRLRQLGDSKPVDIKASILPFMRERK